MPDFTVLASYYCSTVITVKDVADADEALEKAEEIAKTDESLEEAKGCIQFDEVHSPELMTDN